MQQAKTISDLAEQNSKLHEAAYPEVSPEEERKRDMARKILSTSRLSKDAKKLMLCWVTVGGRLGPSLESLAGVGPEVSLGITNCYELRGSFFEIGQGEYELKESMRSAFMYVLENEQ